jgi:hypothetical protein
MQAEQLEREIAVTMRDTPREPDETKWAYQARARQLTIERLNKAKPASASIRQARQCFLCHKPMGDKPGQVVDIGGGLHMVAHPACYEKLASAGDIKPAVKPVRIVHKAASGELRDMIQKAVHQVVSTEDIWLDPAYHNAHGLHFCWPGDGKHPAVCCPDTATVQAPTAIGK